MPRVKLFVLCAALACVTACGHKKVETAEDLQAAFQTSANNPALTQVKPEVKVWADQAVAAIKADDQATAVVSLRSLRSSGQLTVDQASAVEDMMIKARGALVQRAERGDQQAVAALQMLNMNPR